MLDLYSIEAHQLVGHAAQACESFIATIPLLLTRAMVRFQDASLVYVIGLADFFRTPTNIGDRDGTTVEMVLFAGASYFVICVVASSLVKGLQKKVAA